MSAPPQEAFLVATAQAPIPQGARAFWFEGAEGARLRAAIFPAMAPARGAVVLSGGRTEPIEKYFEVIGELQGRGFTVLTHDWRGQGLSQRLLPDRLKGHATGADYFMQDMRALLALIGAELPRPWIALGHSMGGALTALAAVRRIARFDGIYLSAPMLGMAAVQNLAPAAPLIARTMIGLGRQRDYVVKEAFDPLLGPFEGNILTHDRARYARYQGQLQACPDLALGGVTWGWLGFALEACAALARPEAIRVLDMPVAVVAAGEEQLVLNAPIRRFAGLASCCTYTEIAGALHEVFMETDPRRTQAWAAFDELTARVSPPSA